MAVERRRHPPHARARGWARSHAATLVNATMNQDDLEYITSLLEKDVVMTEKLRDLSSELDRKTRMVVSVLNKIHSLPAQSIPDIVNSAKPLLIGCRDSIALIAEAVPEHEFWRWNHIWHKQIQAAVFCAALVEYLSTGKLLSISQANDVFEIRPEWQDRFHIQAEDYLMGLISLVNELSRYSVNAVTSGNLEEPYKASAFVKNIMSGFSMLNLKNDNLRKRFDSLKYDIKKIEEVVYDISLRGFNPSCKNSA